MPLSPHAYTPITGWESLPGNSSNLTALPLPLPPALLLTSVPSYLSALTALTTLDLEALKVRTKKNGTDLLAP